VALRATSAPIQFKIDRTSLDFGSVGFQEQLVRDVALMNPGAVPFSFCVTLTPSALQRVVVTPAQGTVAGGSKQRLAVQFCPRTPEAINEAFTIQVAQLPPERVTVTAEGVLHSLQLSLQRENQAEFDGLVAQARQAMGRLRLTPRGLSAEREAERLWVCRQISAGMDARAPRYVLDFGSIVRGTGKRRTFKISNLGSQPIFFEVDRASLKGSGFTVEPTSIKKVSPGQEPVILAVTLDAQDQCCTESKRLEVPLSIYVPESPPCIVLLRAEVIVPELAIHPANEIDFGKIICGQCKIVSLEFFNPQGVACEWEYRPSKGTGKDSQSAAAFSVVP
jgi:hypothetical protein